MDFSSLHLEFLKFIFFSVNVFFNLGILLLLCSDVSLPSFLQNIPWEKAFSCLKLTLQIESVRSPLPQCLWPSNLAGW